jgi:DNA-binding PadR family transcriptional regulator
MSAREPIPETPLGRFSEPALFVLVSLAGGPKHGYAMIEDIADLTGSRLGPGTLYGAIARLEASGWIERLPADDRRNPYRLTARGARELRSQLVALKTLTRVGERRLAGA